MGEGYVLSVDCALNVSVSVRDAEWCEACVLCVLCVVSWCVYEGVCGCVCELYIVKLVCVCVHCEALRTL